MDLSVPRVRRQNRANTTPKDTMQFSLDRSYGCGHNAFSSTSTVFPLVRIQIEQLAALAYILRSLSQDNEVGTSSFAVIGHRLQCRLGGGMRRFVVVLFLLMSRLRHRPTLQWRGGSVVALFPMGESKEIVHKKRLRAIRQKMLCY